MRTVYIESVDKLKKMSDFNAMEGMIHGAIYKELMGVMVSDASR